MKTAIPYYRVSTEQQGISGLGLEAQKAAVLEFARTHHILLLNDFVEVESGKKSKRPVLLEALQLCRKEKATLLIAKLDRLGRNVAFVSALMEAKVEFIAVDNPFANKLIVHIIMAFAEHERDQISVRTKEALKAAKARGVILGKHGREVLAVKNRRDSEAFAAQMKPLLRSLKHRGFKTIRQITAELNRMKVPTFRGSHAKWHPPTVHRLVKKMEMQSTLIK